MENESTLKGKTAIISGASFGIGYATAVTLAKAGAAVVIHARRKEKLEAAAKEICDLGGKVLPVVGDIGVSGDIDQLLEKTLSWKAGGGKVDIVVANAGRGLAGGILGSDEAVWEDLYKVNVLGAARLMRRAGQWMVDRKRGDIVVIGSVAGRYISPYSGFYGSTKFAVDGIAESLRREVCQHGVRVSLVMPGIVRSGFQQVAGYTEENFEKSVAQFGKLLEPQAIADGICWLLSLPPHVNVNEIMIRPTGQVTP
jgi:NADP-dependent 3-hydroxy acid dehydrogenase YdfG